MLCSTHADLERSTLRAQSAAYAQSSEIGDRIACLEAVAKLTEAHENAPSPGVARFLAAALGAPTMAERRRALELLLDGQHREETVQGLAAGWREAQKAWRVIDAKLVLSEARQEPSKPNVALTNEDLVEAPEYLVELIRAIGTVRDEKFLPVIREMLRAPLDRTPAPFVVAGAETALAMHCRRATEGVLDLLDELESATAEGRLGKRFGAGGSGLLLIYKSTLENAGVDEQRKIVDALVRYSEARGIPVPAEGERDTSAAWRTWYRTARERIPDRPAPGKP